MLSWEQLSDYGNKIFNVLAGKGYELMQYTGLKDKNGKEIYFQDLMKIEENDVVGSGIYEVIWDEEELGIKLALRKGLIQTEYQKENDIEYDQLGGNWFRVSKVIGDIYSNPELLKK